MKANIPETGQKRVVIIGGGFAGLEIAKKLVKTTMQVVLIDRHNYHQFQPLYYQVATGGLEPGSIAYPLRKIFPKKANIHIRLAEVQEVISSENKIITSIGHINYDYLVVATGAATNFFGMKNIEDNAVGMKTVPQALDIRSMVLQNFEEALLTNDLERRKMLMNIVIVGGGPTGVELAGAFSEMKRFVLPKDFPELDFRQMDIVLVESAPRVLSAMSEESSIKAKKYLEDMHVKVLTGVRLLDYDGESVVLDGKSPLKTATVIWAAGVKGATPVGIQAESIVRGNRIAVDEFNKVKGYDNIYAIGDVAAMATTDYPNGHPQLAPVAQQQGKQLADNLLLLQQNKPLKPFKFNNQGSMATVGRNKAVVELPFYKFGGYFAWLVWMFVHLMSIVGFRNRVAVLVNWFWNYIFYDRALRLIIRPFEREKKI